MTQLLDGMRGGDTDASERLLELVYDELRLVASSKLAREKGYQTLQATSLVHDAWLRLRGSAEPVAKSSALLWCCRRGHATNPDRSRSTKTGPAPWWKFSKAWLRVELHS